MRSYSDFHEVAVDTFMKYVPTCPDFNADDFDTTMDLTYLDVRSGESRNEKRTYPSTCDFVGRALLLKNRAKDGGFVCKDVADWPDSALLHESNHSDSRRADVNIYKNEHSFLWDGDFVDRTRCSDKARVEHAAPNSFALVVIPGECKLVHPGFSSTSSQPFLPDTVAAAKTRSQLCDYITEIQLRQHRSFVYAFYIFRTTVRLMRWDRDGTAVSQPIELKNETEREKFFEFFYCLRNATDTQIEFDPTVTMILPSPALTNPDILALRMAITDLPPSRTKPYIKKAFNDGLWPYYKLQVPDPKNPKKPRFFLVRNISDSDPISPAGRGMKTYIAFDLERKIFCTLKDFWRSVSDETCPELKVYEHLAENGVTGTGTICCGGDLSEIADREDVVTRTQELTSCEHSQRIHCRIVFNEVFIPLKDYLHSKELCTVVFEAFDTHASACKRAGVLHRKISDRSIVIYENPQTLAISGLLIDWNSYHESETLTRANSSGTWRCRSVTLLNCPKKDHELADDIESFFHLLSLSALRFHCHNKRPMEIKTALEVYDHFEVGDGFCLGSSQKLENVQLGILPCRLTTNDAFARLLQSLASMCKQHYATLDWDDLQRRFGVPSAPGGVSSTLASTASPSQDVRNTNNFGIAVGPEGPSTTESPQRILPQATLHAHDAFGAALFRAISSVDGWTLNDKIEDQFQDIPWNRVGTKIGSSKRTLKRSRTSETWQPPNAKRSKTSTSAGPRLDGSSRITRSASKSQAMTRKNRTFSFESPTSAQRQLDQL